MNDMDLNTVEGNAVDWYRLGAGEVEPPHLLMALLRDPSGGVAKMLEEKGVTADWLREKLARQAEA